MNILNHFSESAQNFQSLCGDVVLLDQVERAVKVCVTAIQSKKKIMIAGNGGSAADAQHMAGEFVSRFYYDRAPIAALALTTDTSILTAIGNDYGYPDVFSRQISGLGQSGDIFIAISTSGNSPNIVKAIEAAKSLGVYVVGLTGKTGGKMKELCDICLCMPSDSTPRIQECHLLIEHTICAAVESAIFPR